MPAIRRFISRSVTIMLGLMLFSHPVAAAPFHGGTLSIDLPEGWTASYNGQIRQIMAESADKRCRVSVQVQTGGAEGLNDRQLAETFSAQYNGNQPQKVPGFDNYYFTAQINGMDMTVTLFELGGQILVYIEGGETAKYEKETTRIWNSMTSSDPAEKALFDAVTKI